MENRIKEIIKKTKERLEGKLTQQQLEDFLSYLKKELKPQQLKMKLEIRNKWFRKEGDYAICYNCSAHLWHDDVKRRVGCPLCGFRVGRK